MLYIKDKATQQAWWYGYVTPAMGPMVTFVADGDELEMIIEAMKKTRVPPPEQQNPPLPKAEGTPIKFH